MYHRDQPNDYNKLEAKTFHPGIHVMTAWNSSALFPPIIEDNLRCQLWSSITQRPL